MISDEMSHSEVLARSIMADDIMAKTTFLEWLRLDDKVNLAPVFFALQMLTVGNENKHVGEVAWEGLTLLASQPEPDPSTLGRLYVLLTLNNPAVLSGAARKIHPQTRDGIVLLETALSLRSAYRSLK